MPSSSPDLTGQFAHCVQIFGGTTASSRRLGIDERALRRFITGERPVSEQLLRDTAQALQSLIAEAKSAQAAIAGSVGAEPNQPDTTP